MQLKMVGEQGPSHGVNEAPRPRSAGWEDRAVRPFVTQWLVRADSVSACRTVGAEAP